jgi:hypothetical protein
LPWELEVGCWELTEHRGGEAFFASAHFFDGVFAATALNGPVTVGVEYGFRSARWDRLIDS